MAETDTQLLLRALAFAAEKHQSQRRKDAEARPYINHPIAVANVLAGEGGVQDAEILAAAVLHDTVEDTATTPAELVDTFGARIAAIVAAVSDDKSLPKAVRKTEQVRHAAGLSVDAKQVKLADKICNLRDIATHPPADWPRARKAEYGDWAAAVVAGLRGANPQLEQAFDAARAQLMASLGA